MSLYPESSAVTRAEIVSVNDEGEHVRINLKGFDKEAFTDVVLAQGHGVSVNPPVGSVGIFLRHGSSDRLTALGFETPGRPRSKPPGVPALYNADGTVWKLLPQKADLDGGGKNHHARNTPKYRIEAGDWVVIDAPAIYLGKPPYFPVMTTAGPSQHVFAGVSPAAPDAPVGSVG